MLDLYLMWFYGILISVLWQFSLLIMFILIFHRENLYSNDKKNINIRYNGKKMIPLGGCLKKNYKKYQSRLQIVHLQKLLKPKGNIKHSSD